jgi:hypothetical protein
VWSETVWFRLDDGVLVHYFSDPGFGVELRVRQEVGEVSPTIRTESEVSHAVSGDISD